jgi:ATP-dependent exoDNAse (exonuclease V) beta subunit
MELYFLPETAITTEVDDFEHPDKKRNLLGNVDLFVIDPSGNIHIIDYKTSPKEYNEYNSAKIRTFYY